MTLQNFHSVKDMKSTLTSLSKGHAARIAVVTLAMAQHLQQGMRMK